MKKHIFLLTLLGFAFILKLQAQEPMPSKALKDDCRGGKLNIGLSFAPTFNWMFPNTTGYIRSDLGKNFRAGLDLNINLTSRKNFYFSTGISFEQLGGELNFTDRVDIPGIAITDSTSIFRNYRAQYITIPTAITLKSNSLHNFYICGNIGLYNSLLLKAYQKDGYMFALNDSEEAELWTRQRKTSSEASTFKEAAFVGLGLEYSITRDFRSGIYFNYAHTFTNYFKGRGMAQNSITQEKLKSKIGYLEIVLRINFF